MSFVATYSAYLIVCGLRQAIGWDIVIALVIGGAMIAVIGWTDDLRSLSPKLRLLVHVVAAIWAVCWIRPLGLGLGVVTLSSGPLAYALGVLLVVWFINLFNFMDGIDGIASIEAASCGLAIWAISRASSGTVVASLGLALAASVLGFLPMNWSPAKIFMGDVGSGYLGFTISCLALASEGLGGPPFWIWVVFVGVFVTDATMTLVRRVLQGKSWHEAHRSHVYQLAVQAGHSHKQVTVAVLLINIFLSTVCLFTYGVVDSLTLTTAASAVLVGAHIQLYKHYTWPETSATTAFHDSMDHKY